jgi:ATP-binding cassette subfamily B (MDR/TAP) protein 1
LQVFFALTLASVGISHSSTFTTDTTKAKNAAASVFSIIDRKSKIDPSDESGIILENVKGEIELRHVSFKYPTRPDIQIFRDINLLMRAGKVCLLWCHNFYLFKAFSMSEAIFIGLNFFQTVALVGESGSGKSTVVALLQRFYDPDSGRITLDGTEIQKLQLKWFRQQMGLVGQEPVLFNDTIRANIAYGKGGDATEAEIISAAELANAHKFISSLHQVWFRHVYYLDCPLINHE